LRRSAVIGWHSGGYSASFRGARRLCARVRVGWGGGVLSGAPAAPLALGHLVERDEGLAV
jgi:hypothetical protein